MFSLSLLALLVTGSFSGATWYTCPEVASGDEESKKAQVCVSQAERSCMSEEQAVAIATAFARKRNVALHDLRGPKAEYYCVGPTSCTWIVSYASTNALEVGSRTFVSVDDASCVEHLQLDL